MYISKLLSIAGGTIYNLYAVMLKLKVHAGSIKAGGTFIN